MRHSVYKKLVISNTKIFNNVLKFYWSLLPNDNSKFPFMVHYHSLLKYKLLEIAAVCNPGQRFFCGMSLRLITEETIRELVRNSDTALMTFAGNWFYVQVLLCTRRGRFRELK